MFKNSLLKKMERIFGQKKTTYFKESVSDEQDTLFIEISQARTKVTSKRATAIVMGSIFINSQESRLPYGFFAKQIEIAPKEVTRKLFFYSPEENVISGKVQDLVERRVSFMYLYEESFNPNQGQITSLTTECNI